MRAIMSLSQAIRKAKRLLRGGASPVLLHVVLDPDQGHIVISDGEYPAWDECPLCASVWRTSDGSIGGNQS